jgi:glucosamine--fructose-6-phosphate aminotransferase (isomerizing)
MCGIVGYTGGNPVKNRLIEGLKRLEYRGYDSAGIALQEEGKLLLLHRMGKVAQLEEVANLLDDAAACGIGHTRWATHGVPSERNAHPHASCAGDIAIAHNGIIENFAELRETLQARGHTFTSETDTEVVAHLMEEAYHGRPGTEGEGCHDLLESLRVAVSQIVGAYGIVAICQQEPGRIVATRKDSPIVLAQGDGGCYVASDIVAVIKASRDVAVLGDGQFADMTPEGIAYSDGVGNALEPATMHVDWDMDMVEKGGYADFMLKEIHEQPRVVRDTLAGRLTSGSVQIDELSLSLEEMNLIDRVCIIACGTSYHAGLIAKQLIEMWARIPTEVEVASEFRYRNPIITPSTLVVAVSQSGETADTLAAIRDARIKGAKVFGITNVVGSPVARESDGVIYTKANKEIAVASTKSFLGQIVSLTLLALLLAQSKGKLRIGQIRMLYRELADTAEQIERILADTDAIEEAALACKDASSALFIGRGMGSAICYEGALKLKEISYLHAEAYAAGEMKHGPIALVDEGFPVIVVATQSPVYEGDFQCPRKQGARRHDRRHRH